MNRDGRVQKDDGPSGSKNAGRDQNVIVRDDRDLILGREALERLEVTRAPDTPHEKAPRPEAPPAADKPAADIDAHVDQCLSMVIHHEEVQVMAAVIKRVRRDHPCKSQSA